MRTCSAWATPPSSSRPPPAFWRWLEPLERDIEDIARDPNERLRLVQHGLIELIERLDVGRVRFPEQIERA